MNAPKIFISYCHANLSKARKIESDLEVLGIGVVRDERALLYTEDIASYMKSIRNSDYALALVSDDFLKSIACMYEVYEFFKDDNHRNKILPVIIDDYEDTDGFKSGAKIYDYAGMSGYIQYWEQKEKALRDILINIDISNMSHLAKELSLIQSTQKTISNFIFLLRQIKHISFNQLIQNDYRDLLVRIGYANIGLSEVRKSKSLFNQAMAEVTIESRLKFLNRALDINPFNTEALSKKGQILDELKQYEEALSVYNKAISLTPWKAALYINRSYTYIRLNAFTSALTDLATAISIEPMHKEAYNNRADVYRRIGDFDKAISDIERVLQIDSEFDLAYATLAEIYSAIGNNEEFYNNLKKAVEFGYPLHKYSYDDIYKKYYKEADFIQLMDLSQKKNTRFI